MAPEDENKIVEAMAKAAYEFRPDGKKPIVPWNQTSDAAKDFHLANMRAAFRVAQESLAKIADIVAARKNEAQLLAAKKGDDYAAALCQASKSTARGIAAAIRQET